MQVMLAKEKSLNGERNLILEQKRDRPHGVLTHAYDAKKNKFTKGL